MSGLPSPGTLTVHAPDGIGEVSPGDDLAAILLGAFAPGSGLELRDGDILVVTTNSPSLDGSFGISDVGRGLTAIGQRDQERGDLLVGDGDRRGDAPCRGRTPLRPVADRHERRVRGAVHRGRVHRLRGRRAEHLERRR